MSVALWYMSLSEKDRKLMSDIVSLAGGFTTGTVMTKLDLHKLIPALKGDLKAPEWMLSVAKKVVPVSDSPPLRSAVTSMLSSALETRGHSLSDLRSLIAKLGPHIDVDVDVKAPPEAAIWDALKVVSNRVVDAADEYRPTGIVICPECGFTHIV